MDWLDYLPQVLSISRALPHLPSRVVLEIASFLDYDAVTFTDDSTTRFNAANPCSYRKGNVRTDTDTDLGHDVAYLQGRGEAVHPPPEVLEAYSAPQALDGILSAYARNALPCLMALPPLCGQGYGVFDRVHVPVAVASDEDTLTNPYIPCAVPIADPLSSTGVESASADTNTGRACLSATASTSTSTPVDAHATPVGAATATEHATTATVTPPVVDGGASAIVGRYKYMPRKYDPRMGSDCHPSLLLTAAEAEDILWSGDSGVDASAACTRTPNLEIQVGGEVKVEVKTQTTAEEEAKEGAVHAPIAACASHASTSKPAAQSDVLRPVFGEGFRQCVPVAITSKPISVAHTRYSAAQLHALHLTLTRIAIHDQACTNTNTNVDTNESSNSELTNAPVTTLDAEPAPPLPLTHRPYLGSPLSLLSLHGYIDAEDQGWGNQKGTVMLCLNRPATGQQWHLPLTAVERRGRTTAPRHYFRISRADLLSGRWMRADTEHHGDVGMSPFSAAMIPRPADAYALFWPAEHVNAVLQRDSTEAAVVAQHLSQEEPGHLPGDFLSIRVLVGGGGGHALTVQRHSVRVEVDVARELQNNAELFDVVIRADRARLQRLTKTDETNGRGCPDAGDGDCGDLMAMNMSDVKSNDGTAGNPASDHRHEDMFVLEYGSDRYPLRVVANVDVPHTANLCTRICEWTKEHKRPLEPVLRALSACKRGGGTDESLSYDLLRNKATELLRKRKTPGNDENSQLETMKSLLEALARDPLDVLSDMHVSVYADTVKGKVLPSPLRVPFPSWVGAGVAGAALQRHRHVGGLPYHNTHTNKSRNLHANAHPRASAENEADEGVVAHDGGVVEDLEVSVPVLFFTETGKVSLVNVRTFHEPHVAKLVRLLRVASKNGGQTALIGLTQAGDEEEEEEDEYWGSDSDEQSDAGWRSAYAVDGEDDHGSDDGSGSGSDGRSDGITNSEVGGAEDVVSCGDMADVDHIAGSGSSEDVASHTANATVATENVRSEDKDGEDEEDEEEKEKEAYVGGPVVVPVIFPRGLGRRWLSGQSYY